jgi:hypothetical protein
MTTALTALRALCSNHRSDCSDCSEPPYRGQSSAEQSGRATKKTSNALNWPEWYRAHRAAFSWPAPERADGAAGAS